MELPLAKENISGVQISVGPILTELDPSFKSHCTGYDQFRLARTYKVQNLVLNEDVLFLHYCNPLIAGHPKSMF